MKFVADINIAQDVIKNLRQNGHNVLDIKKENPKISDADLIKVAQIEKRIILTHDKDFEILVSFAKYQVGIIALRLRIQEAEHHWQKLNSLISTSNEEILSQSLTVIKEDAVILTPYNR
jgi:predicted nuclease of predicted toxin-antitoxin system